MDQTLIISLVTVIISAISSLSLVNWRLKEIEKRLDSHNHYAQKFADASTDIALIKQDLTYVKEKLDKLEVQK